MVDGGCGGDGDYDDDESFAHNLWVRSFYQVNKYDLVRSVYDFKL